MYAKILVLTSESNTSLVKTFSGSDLKEQPFSIGKEFNVTEEPVSDLQSLSKLLQRLENDPTDDYQRVTDREANQPRPSQQRNLHATPRQWCMIDIDSLAWDGDIN